MAKLTVEEQKEYPTLPAESILHLLVEEVDVRTVQGQRGNWDKLEFKFKIMGVQSVPSMHPSNFDNLLGEPIWGSCPFKLTDSAENKLRLWAEAILNRPLEVGFELDTDYFLRREVRGMTSTYEKRARDSQGRPFIGHQISALMPMGNGNGQAVVPGGAVQQAPQAPPQSWGGQSAPAADPWAAQAPAPQQGDPWAAQQQAPQVAPQQQTPAPANVGGTSGWVDDEPPF